MASTYTPAWQRLGLKLRSPTATDTSSFVDTPEVPTTSRKRKLQHEAETIQVTQDTTKRTKRASNGFKESSADLDDLQENSGSRRKSVTFSPDTKVEDGDSSKRLVQAAFASKLARTTGLEEWNIVAATEELNNLSKQSQNLKPKIRTNAGKKGIAVNGISDEKDNQTTPHSPLTRTVSKPSSKVEAARQKKKHELAIQYLKEYKDNRTTWKFNKSRQVAVLKMVLDCNSIPTVYDESLKQYLEGLKGEGSRRNLRGEAQGVLSKVNDQENLSALAEVKVLRAKLIVEALGLSTEQTKKSTNRSDSDAHVDLEGSLTQDEIHTTKKTLNGTMDSSSVLSRENGITIGEVNVDTKKKRRRRIKKRRNVSESESSSSSSSADSDSDSDG